MLNVNDVTIRGNASNNIEFKSLPSGNPVCEFSLATNESWMREGQKHEHTEWHNIVTHNKIAEIAKEKVIKGKLIEVKGYLRTRSWIPKNSEHKVYRTEIIAKKITVF